jgi:predicted dinucleotide-binding enzyme
MLCYPSSMKVGIIGPGRVGATLGAQLLKKQIPVKYGSRDPSSPKVAQLLREQPDASADVVAKTVGWADVVILTTRSAHSDEVIRSTADSLGDGIKVGRAGRHGQRKMLCTAASDKPPEG